MTNRALGLFCVAAFFIFAPFPSRFRSTVRHLDFFPFNRRVIYDIISDDNILDGSHNARHQSSLEKVIVGQEGILSGNISIGL